MQRSKFKRKETSKQAEKQVDYWKNKLRSKYSSSEANMNANK